MLERNLTMDDVNFAIKHAYNDDVSCVFSDYNDDNLVFRIRLNKALRKQVEARWSPALTGPAGRNVYAAEFPRRHA